MKLFILAAVASLANAFIPIENITLTKCPTPNDRSPSCYQKGPQVVRPNSTHQYEFGTQSPDSDRRFIQVTVLDWDAEYSLTWDSPAVTQPVFFTWNASGYNFTKEFQRDDERRFNFSFKDLAKQMLRMGNETDQALEARILGASANHTDIYMYRHEDYEEPTRFELPLGVAGGVSILPYEDIERFDYRLKSAMDDADKDKRDAIKKWKIGVGVAVGVGVPIILAIFTTAGFMVGRGRSKDKTAPIKQDN